MLEKDERKSELESWNSGEPKTAGYRKYQKPEVLKYRVHSMWTRGFEMTHVLLSNLSKNLHLKIEEQVDKIAAWTALQGCWSDTKKITERLEKKTLLGMYTA